MRTEIYHCDQCEKETQENNIRRINIEFELDRFGKRLYNNIEICNFCAEKVGFTKKIIKDDKIVEEVQDVKDRLFDVVAEIIQEIGVQIEYS
jgi:hypothetical protein